MQNRRRMLRDSAALAAALAGLGLLPQVAQAAWNRAAFGARKLEDLIQVLGVSAPTESSEVVVSGPDVAENGAVVAVGCESTASGVRQLLLLVEKNPNMLAMIFDVNEHAEPAFNTRLKMAESSRVIAIALADDGRVLYAQKEIDVTLGGCGG
ncbi:MAG TPA: thiosulfate oxidation carrier protein SoxY [Rubrivivax sp.]|nr:thiosulfate oxidation carrier protein SoxY [Rubrivivax sp.]